MSLQISERTTDYTHTTEKIIHQNKGRYNIVSHRTENTKYFLSVEEVDHAIHYLVVDKGYLMDSDRGGLIVFTHPLHNWYNYTSYTYDTTSMSMTKVSEKLLDIV